MLAAFIARPPGRARQNSRDRSAVGDRHCARACALARRGPGRGHHRGGLRRCRTPSDAIGVRGMTLLRRYQTDIAAEFEHQVERGDRSILLVAPTGSGKTVIAAAIIAGKARRVLVVAHRREIVNQTSDKLTARAVPHGIIQAGDEKKLRPMAAVQVASIQTLHARAIRSTTMLMPPADLLIIDEAHHACAMTYAKL